MFAGEVAEIGFDRPVADPDPMGQDAGTDPYREVLADRQTVQLVSGVEASGPMNEVPQGPSPWFDGLEVAPGELAELGDRIAIAAADVGDEHERQIVDRVRMAVSQTTQILQSMVAPAECELSQRDRKGGDGLGMLVGQET